MALKLFRDERREHLAEHVARAFDRGDEAESRLVAAIGIFRIRAGTCAHELAAKSDLLVVEGEAEVGVLFVERLRVVYARADDAELEDRNGGRAEGAGHGRIETQPLKFAASRGRHARAVQRCCACTFPGRERLKASAPSG